MKRFSRVPIWRPGVRFWAVWATDPVCAPVACWPERSRRDQGAPIGCFWLNWSQKHRERARRVLRCMVHGWMISADVLWQSERNAWTKRFHPEAGCCEGNGVSSPGGGRPARFAGCAVEIRQAGRACSGVSGSRREERPTGSCDLSASFPSWSAVCIGQRAYARSTRFILAHCVGRCTAGGRAQHFSAVRSRRSS